MDTNLSKTPMKNFSYQELFTSLSSFSCQELINISTPRNIGNPLPKLDSGDHEDSSTQSQDQEGQRPPPGGIPPRPPSEVEKQNNGTQERLPLPGGRPPRPPSEIEKQNNGTQGRPRRPGGRPPTLPFEDVNLKDAPQQKPPRPEGNQNGPPPPPSGRPQRPPPPENEYEDNSPSESHDIGTMKSIFNIPIK
ncbi:hypothetical protein HPG69_004171 [Diceros bicornis minor]|uniref:Uncharacterized protein n=1 Tax=Diceros bicornis minor TaxID=77932 RepID=A0A7J7E9I7_DICBM|nr:hypothetical protein HPG69_004171 [Diceros bicornis minor]